MIRNWYNQIPYPALKTKREITKYINWRQFTKGTRGKQNEQLLSRVSASLKLKFNYFKQLLKSTKKLCHTVFKHMLKDGLKCYVHSLKLLKYTVTAQLDAFMHAYCCLYMHICPVWQTRFPFLSHLMVG